MSKKDYTSYPPQYFQLIEEFAVNGQEVELEGTYSEMVYVRHDLNRFFVLLRSAGRAGDKYAQNLSETTRDIVLSIIPSRARKDEPAKLILKINPIVKAVLKFAPKD